MLKQLNRSIMKALILYLVYFLYSLLATSLISSLNVPKTSYIMFPFDIFFLVFSIFLYHKELSSCVEKLKKQKFSKTLVNIILGILSIMILNAVMGMLTDLFFPGEYTDSNTSAMLDLLKTSPIYAFFKVLIFAPIAEEILFRESISTCTKNNLVFILLSAVIYTCMNFIFNASSLNMMDILIYFLPALLFSYIFVKNDNNIIIVMIIKFFLQFIPFIMLLFQR